MRQLSELVSQVKDEQGYIVVRERTHRNTAESTNARVKWWSIFQILVLGANGGFQVWWLKRFFEVSQSHAPTSTHVLTGAKGQAGCISIPLWAWMSHEQHCAFGVTALFGLFGCKYDRKYMDTMGTMQYSKHRVFGSQKSEQHSYPLLSTKKKLHLVPEDAFFLWGLRQRLVISFDR